MCNICLCLRFFPVRGKNLAMGGNVYQSSNDSETVISSTTPTVANGSCQTSQDTDGGKWRVDFDKLIEVYAIEITPGKWE